MSRTFGAGGVMDSVPMMKSSSGGCSSAAIDLVRGVDSVSSVMGSSAGNVSVATASGVLLLAGAGMLSCVIAI